MRLYAIQLLYVNAPPIMINNWSIRSKPNESIFTTKQLAALRCRYRLKLYLHQTERHFQTTQYIG